ncbi:hypothetical protein ST47_g7951 [Ascochyta rabiei]|uniref:Uncharacterized protein n=2 Tax=Didymella rabiei TaxID=5454 RepID=A0A163A156_DIDRA|nr:hypothetical protein ST47_g7951 [Ascochyta rabiei]
MSISNRLPYGVAREQALIAQQNRNNAPSNWPESSRSPPTFKEGDPIRKTDTHRPQAGVNAAVKPKGVNDPFDDSHSVHIKDTNSFTYWKCPRCQSQRVRSPERLMNLARTGRYFFECSAPNCGTALVVIRRKDSALDTVEELREPLVEGELTIHGKNEVVPTTKLLKKMKKKRRITKKLERVKKGWAKSKRFVREKGKAFVGTLGWLNRPTADSDTSESVKVVTAPLKSVSQDRPDVPPPLTLSTLQLSKRVKSDTRLASSTPASQPLRSVSDGSGGSRRDHHPQEPPDSQRFSRSSDIDSDQASFASRRTEEMMEASGPAHSLNAIVAGPPNELMQQAKEKGKRPVKATELFLQCRFCSATFSGDDALLLHVTSSHSEMGGKLPVQPSSTDLSRGVGRKPSQQDKRSLCEGEEEEEGHGEEDSVYDDDEELYPQCQYCPHTFNSDTGRLKHQAEAHPDEVEREVWAVRTL